MDALSLDEEGRKSLIDELRTETTTKQLGVQLMQKGIFPRGFPTLKDIKPAFKEEYASDANELKKLVFEASESKFSRQLLQSKPLEMQLRGCRDSLRIRPLRDDGDECVLF